ncbi:MAG: CHC2 zinc finger domain-containing protein, partial [Eubacterium sp.]
MLVEREKILKAKKKLSDKSARIISDILFIKEYDERNMKGLCPFHDEDTPSFIYNSKTYNFHCFGCGRNVDIIDACIHQGFTYAQAVQKLFEMSGINHSFGEVGVRTKHSYRYPKPE